MKFGLFASTALFLLSVCALPALAANSPCSGKKGGIAGCPTQQNVGLLQVEDDQAKL
ncbi:hypothetical protein ACLBVE_34665, partial [Pseudomonas aeruginosa]